MSGSRRQVWSSFISRRVTRSLLMCTKLCCRRNVCPGVRAECPEGNYVFQQDGARSHTAKSTTDFLDKEDINYWPPSMWPPASPDLNPLDCAIWSRLVRKVNAKPHSNTKGPDQSHQEGVVCRLCPGRTVKGLSKSSDTFLTFLAKIRIKLVVFII